MYPSIPDELKKSPAPSAPPANYGYGQANEPPPATGIPISSSGFAYTGVSSAPQPPPPAQFQTTPGYWSTGLCDCGTDVSNCCLTCWCPCITFGQIAEIVDKGSTSCGASGALYALIGYFTGCACIYSCFYRSRMRQQYMLPESPCADFLVHCCCETCALCQEYRELKHRGFDMSIGWHGNMDKQNPGVATAPFAQHGMDR